MMATPSRLNEIAEAAATLALPARVLRQLTADEAARVSEALRRKFAPGGGTARWWWEHFESFTAMTCADGRGFERIDQVVPNAEAPVFFVIDGDSDDAIVFECLARTAQAVIGETSAVEHYLTPNDLRWVVCENHHNELIASGETVRELLRAVAAREGTGVLEVG